MATQKQNGDWYKKNKNRHKARVVARREELRLWFKELKSKLKCEECGQNHPAILTFHHLDPNGKELNIAQAVNSYTWGKERILKEIKKCQVLCHNCHAIVHWDDNNIDA